LLTLAVRSSHRRENPLAAGEQGMHAREAESESYRRPGNLSPACVSGNDGSQTSLALAGSFSSGCEMQRVRDAKQVATAEPWQRGRRRIRRVDDE
jgi:hypothetical protein